MRLTFRKTQNVDVAAWRASRRSNQQCDLQHSPSSFSQLVLLCCALAAHLKSSHVIIWKEHILLMRLALSSAAHPSARPSVRPSGRSSIHPSIHQPSVGRPIDTQCQDEVSDDFRVIKRYDRLTRGHRQQQPPPPPPLAARVVFHWTRNLPAHTHTRMLGPTGLSPGLEMDFCPLVDHMGLIHISIDLDEEMKRAGRNQIRRRKLMRN